MSRRRGKGALAACVLALWIPAAGWAQVQLKAKMEHDSLLPYEPANLLLTFTNASGLPVVITEKDSTFRFKLELVHENGFRVPSRGVPIIHDKFILAANDSREFRLNLLKVFSLQQQGMYTAKAMVIQEGQVQVTTKVFFDIVAGTEVNRFVTSRPKRVFILRTLNRNRMDRLLLHIQDEKAETVYGVYDLGSWMRSYAPEVRYDEDSNLHLLHRGSPSQYNHSIFSAQGRPLEREYYRVNKSIPQLKPTPDGGMTVVGASRVKS